MSQVVHKCITRKTSQVVHETYNIIQVKSQVKAKVKDMTLRVDKFSFEGSISYQIRQPDKLNHSSVYLLIPKLYHIYES